MTLFEVEGCIHSSGITKLIFLVYFLEVERLTLSEGSVLEFLFDASYHRRTEFLERREQSRQRRNAENFEDSFSMNVRARNNDGFLWRAQDNLGNYTQLQVRFYHHAKISINDSIQYLRSAS
jgi:hypothetical protein